MEVKVKVPNHSITATVNKQSPEIDNSSIKVVKGDKGAVFTPYVDEYSNLSWSNDGNLPNPPTQNIRGRDGEATIHAITNIEIEKIMEG